MSQEDLDSFVSWLNDKRIPAFSSTVSTLTKLTAKDDTSISELVLTILKDAAMTAQILRVANSSFYNPTISRTGTVTRAVMLIGFESVRSICLSIKVIESFLRGARREELVKEMARCFHAAVQARSIAKVKGDECPEEIFVAALLFRIGEIAFWAFCPDETCEELESRLSEGKCSSSIAETEVLGFRLRELTTRLIAEWSLGELLINACAGNPSNNLRVKYILVGYELALILEDGWENPRLKRLVKQLVEFIKKPEERVYELLRSNSSIAAKTVASYGAEHISRLIPAPMEEDENPPSSPSRERAEDGKAMHFAESDPCLQLQILREYAALLTDGKQNPKLLISMILEGILRGVAMDRVLFAAITPDAKNLRVTHALGWTPETPLPELPPISLNSTYNVFSHVLKTRKAKWLKEETQDSSSQLVPGEIKQIMGNPPFFVGPVFAFNRPVGVICSDRNLSGKDLDEESFAGFRSFCNQASVGLAFIQRAANSQQ
ncbi:MAG: HDOD domain-containing protein [Deltaproteobacteria bacterium]|nr:HDOD domain-containing protein [Deltaproteobacteria bacterium]